MNMQPNQHPDDERLSALAGADAEALGDVALRGHVDSCHRCGTLVAELRAMRSALASMPDLAPTRPLRILAPAEARPDRMGGLARRLFAPVLAAGAALALAGVVGTMGDLGMIGMPAGGGDFAAQQEADQRDAGGAAEPAASEADGFGATTFEAADEDDGERTAATTDLTERSPWPMVAFAGAAIAAAAILLRWVLAARPG